MFAKPTVNQVTLAVTFLLGALAVVSHPVLSQEKKAGGDSENQFVSVSFTGRKVIQEAAKRNAMVYRLGTNGDLFSDYLKIRKYDSLFSKEEKDTIIILKLIDPEKTSMQTFEDFINAVDKARPSNHRVRVFVRS